MTTRCKVFQDLHPRILPLLYVLVQCIGLVYSEVMTGSIGLDVSTTPDTTVAGKILAPNLDKEPKQPVKHRHTDRDERLKLAHIDPVEVGHVRQVELEPGKFYEMRTVAIKPPIFVIPNFLSDEECDQIVSLSRDAGLVTSVTRRKATRKKPLTDQTIKDAFVRFDTDGDGFINTREMKKLLKEVFHAEDLCYDELQFILTDALLDLNSDMKLDEEEFTRIPRAQNYISYLVKALKMRPMPTEIFKKLRKGQDRKSSQARLEHELYDPDRKLRKRLAALTQVPSNIVHTSELLHVVHYNRSGHYHGHTDSHYLTPDSVCEHSSHLYPNTSSGVPPKTRICRYMTILYYLNEPEMGGQTAFPIADNETYSKEGVTFEYKSKHRDIFDLTNHCVDSNIVVQPQKGTAVMWYNHYADEEKEWMGDLIPFSLHGGCEVIKGEKWIANNWIDVDDNYDMQMAYIADRIRPNLTRGSLDSRKNNDTKQESQSSCKSPSDWSNGDPMASHDEL